MNGERPAANGFQADHPALRLDAACDRFEAAWKQGGRPRIEDHLVEIEESERPELRRELLALELELRREAGEAPVQDEYRERFPGNPRLIADAFAAPLPTVFEERMGRTGSETDYQLLFGILALQNDFVSREALVDAFDAWVADNSKPMAEALMAWGQLDAAQNALLDLLVREHLRLIGGDARKQLAAIDSLGSARDALRGIADPNVQGSRLRAAAGGLDGPGASPSANAPRASRFRILRPHARGGLGEVFVAYDGELHREVALKEIRSDRADDLESRTRFVLEAEITGCLEHPGVVPVYGLGYSGDGRPHYAMRFVDGDSLKEAIARFHEADGLGRDPGERALALRGLLGRFVDVCDAVSYAHSRGVLHRDIKPENVMLGNYGETLVVDWGLAKAFGQVGGDGANTAGAPLRPHSASASAPTVAGLVIGTPAYMSPEQAEGDFDRLGPGSDLYSLGATLYCLLTGRAPLGNRDGDVSGVLRRVRAGEIDPPRRVKRNIPPALEAVCLKAMSLDIEDRYATPRALADDIEHWLADEPVSAWREPLPVRLRRWAKRHRTAVSATATGFAAALLAGGIGLSAYQRQLGLETFATEAAMVRAEQARGDARTAWAERLETTAWARAEDLAAAASALESPRLPAEVRRRLRDLTVGVKAESGKALADAALLNDLATIRAARYDSQYDAPSEYGQTFRKRVPSIDLSDPSATAARLLSRPAPVVVQIATYLDDWSLLLFDEEGSHREADQIIAVAHAVDPNPWRNSLRETLSIRDRAEQARAVKRLAEAPDVLDQPSATITLLTAVLRHAKEPDAAIRLLESARFRYLKDPWIHQEFGLALTMVRPARHDDAMRAFAVATSLRPEMGYELADSLNASGRTSEAISVMEDVVRRRPEARDLLKLGSLMTEAGRHDEAAVMSRRAAASSRSRLAVEPNNDLTHTLLGAALRSLGDSSGALAEFRESIRLRPGSSLAHQNLGSTLFESGDLNGAIAELRESIRLKPGDHVSHSNLGIILYRLGKPVEAIPELQEGIRLGDELQEKRISARINLGLALRVTGDLAGAIATFRALSRMKPDSAEIHNNLGLVLRESGNVADGIAEHREALRLDPSFASAHNYLGVALRASGDLAGAIAESRMAVLLGPNDPTNHNNLACFLNESGDHAGAIEEYREAVRLGPNDPFTQCNLGLALRDAGRYKEALAAMELGHALGTRRGDWRSPSADWLRKCQRLVELEDKLPSILAGQDRSIDAAELIELTEVAYGKGLYAAAALLYAQAVADRPELADDPTSGPRYNAACAAALAGCGRGKDEPQPDDDAKGKLREQARELLKEELAAWTKVLDTNPAASKAKIASTLQHWKVDPDLVGIRNEEKLAKLPEAERTALKRLWADVGQLVARLAVVK